MGRKGHKKLKKHPSVDYEKTYSSQEEAMQSPDVKTAAKHHKVCLMRLVQLLTSGMKLLYAIFSLITYFSSN